MTQATVCLGAYSLRVESSVYSVGCQLDPSGGILGGTYSFADSCSTRPADHSEGDVGVSRVTLLVHFPLSVPSGRAGHGLAFLCWVHTHARRRVFSASWSSCHY